MRLYNLKKNIETDSTVSNNPNWIIKSKLDLMTNRGAYTLGFLH